jgi:hypothetical protein
MGRLLITAARITSAYCDTVEVIQWFLYIYLVFKQYLFSWIYCTLSKLNKFIYMSITDTVIYRYLCILYIQPDRQTRTDRYAGRQAERQLKII